MITGTDEGTHTAVIARRARPGGLVILGAALFLSFAYLYEGGGWNQNTRFDLVRAIVERGTIQIDAYHQNSGDKAIAGGHVYADKAPGASFVAAPAVYVAREILVALGRPASSPANLMWLSYLATLAASAIPATIAALCLFVLARRMGATESAAAIATIIFALGTPVWAFGALFFGHTLTAACLVAAMLFADQLRAGEPRPAREAMLAALVGVSAGWAVVTEYPGAIGAVTIALLVLVGARSSGSRRFLRIAVGLVLGAGLAASVLGVYNWSAFGSPFHMSYASEENQDLLRAGFFGITLPKPRIIGELLWGWYRGLLPLAPVLALAPIGWWMLCRRSATRWLTVAGASMFIVTLLFNAAYEHWEGGWSYGPRHLVPALAFVCLGIFPIWMRAGHVLRACIVALMLVGVGSSLIAVSTTPQPPAGYQRPMQELLWPAFRDGLLSLNRASFNDYDQPGGGGWAGMRGSPAPRAAWNLGEKAGLHGLPSLLPLLGIRLIAGAAWVLAGRRRDLGRAGVSRSSIY